MPGRSILRVGILRIANIADIRVVTIIVMPIMLNVVSDFGISNPANTDNVTANKNDVSAKNIGVLTSHCLSVVCWSFIAFLPLVFYFTTICPDDKVVISVGPI